VPRQTRRTFRRIAVVGGIVLSALTSTPALAQRDADKPLPPYDVAGLEQKKIIVPWLFAFFFVAGTLAIALKNPHRSHLD
jgi:hypothetical protein